MSKITFFLIIISTLMSACYDRYRYPCQDPKNINTLECSVEACKMSHNCPSIEEGTVYAK